MEINITNLFENAPLRDYSASAFELGQDAGRITWEAAKADADDWLPEFTEDDLDELRQYFKSFGAWENIDEWDANALRALLLQDIAGSIREVPGMEPGSWDWKEYEQLAEKGIVSGRFFRADDGDIYYYVGD